MSKNLIIMDTCDVFLKSKVDGSTIMTTTTTLASVGVTVDSTDLVAGIGSGVIAVLNTSKKYTLNFAEALFNLDFIAMNSGVKVQKNGTATIRKSETVKTTGTAPSLKATIVGTPKGTKVNYVDADGTIKEGAVAVKEVTLTGTTLKSGDLVTITYDSDVTGEMVTFDSKKFPSRYEIILSTIAYNPVNDSHEKNIYIQFDEVKPDGNFEMSFAGGEAQGHDLTFNAMVPATSGGELGRILIEDVVTP